MTPDYSLRVYNHFLRLYPRAKIDYHNSHPVSGCPDLYVIISDLGTVRVRYYAESDTISITNPENLSFDRTSSSFLVGVASKLSSCFTYVFCFFAVSILIAFFSSSGDDDSKPAHTSPPVITLSPAATPEEAVMYYGNLFGGNHMITQKVSVIVQSIDGERSLNINAHYTGDTDDRVCVRGCLEYILRVLSSMKDYPGDFDNLQFVITSSGYVDKYGNSSTPLVMTAHIKRDTMQKINYGYFLDILPITTEQPLNSFDSYYVHDLISSGVY